MAITLIQSIAGKLSADGLQINTLTKENALNICKNCVGFIEINFSINNNFEEIKREFLKFLYCLHM